MGFFLDVAVLAVLIIFVWLGYRKGLIKSVMGLVSLGVSIILAVNFYSYPSHYINEHVITPYFTNNTSEEFESLMNGGTETISPEQILEDKPDALTDILNKYGIDISSIKEYYENNIKPSIDSFKTDEIADKLSDFIVESTAETVSNILGFLIVFVTALVVINLLLKLLNLMFKLPVLKFANKLLGAILGLVKGLIVTVIVVNVVSGLVSAVGEADDSFWSRSALESSVSYTTVADAGLIIDIMQ